MERFTLGQRVRVADPMHPMEGKAGKVVRLRMADDGAWVDMDEPLPGDLRSFPADDEHGRANHTVLYPFECKAVKA